MAPIAIDPQMAMRAWIHGNCVLSYYVIAQANAPLQRNVRLTILHKAPVSASQGQCWLIFSKRYREHWLGFCNLDASTTYIHQSHEAPARISRACELDVQCFFIETIRRKHRLEISRARELQVKCFLITQTTQSHNEPAQDLTSPRTLCEAYTMICDIGNGFMHHVIMLTYLSAK
jgi:hypothetical protein